MNFHKNNFELNNLLNWINFGQNSNIELNQFGYWTGLPLWYHTHCLHDVNNMTNEIILVYIQTYFNSCKANSFFCFCLWCMATWTPFILIEPDWKELIKNWSLETRESLLLRQSKGTLVCSKQTICFSRSDLGKSTKKKLGKSLKQTICFSGSDLLHWWLEPTMISPTPTSYLTFQFKTAGQTFTI